MKNVMKITVEDLVNLVTECEQRGMYCNISFGTIKKEEIENKDSESEVQENDT